MVVYLPLYAGHLVSVCVRQQSATAPAAVDVHPQRVLLTHVSDFVEGVVRAQDGRTARSIHKEWVQALRIKAGLAVCLVELY